MPDWIDAAEAARRLGIKPATLYAYVSRGVLTRRHDENGRRSLFDAADIDRLARRGRPRHPQPELVIESAITALGVDRPHYRGVDALRLAESTPFEAVAAWLWTATPPVPRTPPDSASDAASGEAAPWVGEPAAVGAAIHTQRSLPPDLLPLDRLQVITTVLGAADSLRFHLDPDSVIATAKRLIAGLVDALPKLCPPTGPTIPHRLWAALSPAPPPRSTSTPCAPRWSCWPTTNWPRPPSPPASPPPPEPTRMPWSRRVWASWAGPARRRVPRR